MTTTPTDWRAFFSGRFLTGPDCEKEPTWTIHAVEAENIENPDDQSVKRKMVVHFRESDSKPWIPCRTTAECVAAMFGDNPQEWPGKPITLFFDKSVRVGREVKGGVRVKGSPALDRKVKVQVKLPRRRPLDITLHPTGKGGGQSNGPTAEAAERALHAALAQHDLMVENLDAYRASEDKPPALSLQPGQVSRLAAFLNSPNGGGMIAKVKAHIGGGPDSFEE